MEKYATKTLAQVPACEAFEFHRMVMAQKTDGTSARRDCGSCAFYSHATNTRLSACPYSDKGRPEDPRD